MANRRHGSPVVWALAFSGWAAACLAQEAADRPGMIHAADYEIAVLGDQERGSLLWLEGPDGILRVEIRAGGRLGPGAARLTALLEQAGQGWTAVLGGRGDDTINAWGQEWRQPPPGLAPAARFLAAAIVGGPDGPPDRRLERRPGSRTRWRAGCGGTAVLRQPIPALFPSSTPGDPRPEFRHLMSARGNGRGGEAAVLEWRWQAGTETGTRQLAVRVTRLPGQLVLSAWDATAVVYAMPEAFVPLWPLSELVNPIP